MAEIERDVLLKKRLFTGKPDVKQSKRTVKFIELEIETSLSLTNKEHITHSTKCPSSQCSLTRDLCFSALISQRSLSHIALRL